MGWIPLACTPAGAVEHNHHHYYYYYYLFFWNHHQIKLGDCAGAHDDDDDDDCIPIVCCCVVPAAVCCPHSVLPRLSSDVVLSISLLGSSSSVEAEKRSTRLLDKEITQNDDKVYKKGKEKRGGEEMTLLDAGAATP